MNKEQMNELEQFLDSCFNCKNQKFVENFLSEIETVIYNEDDKDEIFEYRSLHGFDFQTTFEFITDDLLDIKTHRIKEKYAQKLYDYYYDDIIDFCEENEICSIIPDYPESPEIKERKARALAQAVETINQALKKGE
jgi:hypothetical protein